MSDVFSQGFRFWSNKSIPQFFSAVADTNDELIITINGVDNPITIPEGKYETNYNMFSSNLTTAINNALSEANIPVMARLGGIHDDSPRAVLIFEHTDLTETGETRTISAISGSASASIVSSQPFKLELPLTPSGKDISHSDLDSNIGIQGYGELDMLSVMGVPAYMDEDFDSAVAVRQAENIGVDSSVAVRLSVDIDVDASVTVNPGV